MQSKKETIYDMIFFNRDTAIVYYSNSLIQKTTDRGKSWYQLDSRLTSQPCFIDDKTGYFCNGSLSSSLIKTTDGGESWHQVDNSDHRFAMFPTFISEKTGIAFCKNSGDNFTKIMTTDSGKTWVNAEFTFPDGETSVFRGLYPVGKDNGFALFHNDRVSSTTDGGLTWIPEFEIPCYFKDLDFYNKSLGLTYASDLICVFYKSDSTWNFTKTPFLDHDYITDATFINDSSIVFVCTNGRIFKSSDSGKTWKESSHGYYDDLFEYCRIDSSAAFIGGDNGILVKTTDNGETWDRMLPKDSIKNNHISFPDRMNGYRIGEFPSKTDAYTPVLQRTTDGGMTWADRNLPSEYFYDFFEFKDSLTGFMIHKNPSDRKKKDIVKTTDGGNSWHSIFTLDLDLSISFHAVSSNTLYFNSMQYFPFFNSWAENYSSRDGGATWAKMPRPSASDTSDQDFGRYFISYADEMNGIALSGYKMCRTTDGGRTWDSAGQVPFKAGPVKFSDIDNGLCLNLDPILCTYQIYYTTNSGKKWEALDQTDFNNFTFKNTFIMKKSGIFRFDLKGLLIKYPLLDSALPVISTLPVSHIDTNSAISGGLIPKKVFPPVTARGVVWSHKQNPTLRSNELGHTIDSTGAGTFTSAITGLLPKTAYYMAAYAKNAVGTSYGQEIEFTTLPTSVADGTTPTALTVLPSLAIDELRIITSSSQSLHVRVLDVLGRLQMEFNIPPGNPVSTEIIDLSSLPSGIYVLAAGSGTEKLTAKFIKI